MGKINNLKINTSDYAREIYLKSISLGTIYGPMTGYPSKDKPWLKFYSNDAILSKLPEEQTMYQYIYDKNKDHLNRIAINYYGNRFTYEDLFKKIDEYASKFSLLGVKKDDIVSICMPTTPETIFSIYALNKLGAVCDMLDPRSNEIQMDHYLSENKSKLLLLCDNYYEKMKNTLDSKNLDNIVLVPITPSAPIIVKLLVGIKTKQNKARELSSNVIEWNKFNRINSSLRTNININ